MIIRHCGISDSQRMCSIINEAAQAYEGFIPRDCYHFPYMPIAELQEEMKRVTFYGCDIGHNLVCVMGLEPVRDVTLVRHAYTLPDYQRQGYGSKLLEYLKTLATTPRLLVGTWAAAKWAVKFYQKHGFALVENKDELLKAYWSIPPRQIDTSVVLEINQTKGLSNG